ncbi:Uma2 family endonuclease [Calothrix sp. NIES-2098]|uniref:Uma2 family endonuclease n=1 Tax=Calothrix sp. NIES-2098 TaxID=1954171 RepID=UPI000B61A8CE|nr:hypothetical protein NIES2098_58710 [Calothrix sp. NIES-2098]
MAQALSKLVNFDEFIKWYPNNGIPYELHDGTIVEMAPPTGDREKVVAFIACKITVEFDRMELPYAIPKTAFVKPPEAESAYSPDVLLLNLDNLNNAPLWQKTSTVSQGTSVSLVVEVVSTNWRDDYYKKYADYEQMGIAEYWIADYAALGGRNFIGNPKQPTIFVCQLIDGEYQMNDFRGNNSIVSPTFPQLNLTAQQIFDAAL